MLFLTSPALSAAGIDLWRMAITGLEEAEELSGFLTMMGSGSPDSEHASTDGEMHGVMLITSLQVAIVFAR